MSAGILPSGAALREAVLALLPERERQRRHARDLVELVRRLVRRFLKAPGELLLPPPRSAAGPTEAPAHG